MQLFSTTSTFFLRNEPHKELKTIENYLLQLNIKKCVNEIELKN
jgi:hypothetical protein